MKFLTSAPFLLFSAMLAVSLPASADNGGEVKIISRQIDRNLERVSANTEANRATFKNNFRPVKKTNLTANLTKVLFSGTMTARGQPAAALYSALRPAKKSNFPAMIAAISPNRSNPARILKIMSRLKKIFSKPFITVAATLPRSSWNGWISVLKKAVTKPIPVGSATIASVFSAAAATNAMPF